MFLGDVSRCYYAVQSIHGKHPEGGRGEASSEKDGRIGQGRMEMEEPTATATHFCPPLRSLYCASPFSFPRFP